MFRITRDPSSGNSTQCLAKIAVNVLPCPLIWTCVYCVLRQGEICCHNTDYVHIKGNDRTITVILAKHCVQPPDDGSLVIRNMLEQF